MFEIMRIRFYSGRIRFFIFLLEMTEDCSYRMIKFLTLIQNQAAVQFPYNTGYPGTSFVAVPGCQYVIKDR